MLIVGAGPSGVAASVYAGSEGLCALTIEDAAINGQADTSSRIENYMDFFTGISGAEGEKRIETRALFIIAAPCRTLPASQAWSTPTKRAS